jgi:hypothetical protein
VERKQTAEAKRSDPYERRLIKVDSDGGRRSAMTKRKTVFEQVPLAVARRIAAAELKRKEAIRKKAGSRPKASGRPIETAHLSSEGASL